MVLQSNRDNNSSIFPERDKDSRELGNQKMFRGDYYSKDKVLLQEKFEVNLCLANDVSEIHKSLQWR